jgi:hypothetical protein
VHPREARFLKLDTSKARADLGWAPALSLQEALRWIAEWYGAFHAGTDLNAFTRLQIDRYEGLLDPSGSQAVNGGKTGAEKLHHSPPHAQNFNFLDG